MATNQQSISSQYESLEERPAEPGLSHLTVVPTNFDPDAPGCRRD